MLCDYVHVSAHSGLSEHRALVSQRMCEWCTRLGSEYILLHCIRAQKRIFWGRKCKIFLTLQSCKEGNAVMGLLGRKAREIMNYWFKRWFVSTVKQYCMYYHTYQESSVSLSSFKGRLFDSWNYIFTWIWWVVQKTWTTYRP